MNPIQMINSYRQFAQTFQGDPKQKVQELLNSGQMSQQQFNDLQRKASAFQNMMRKM